MACCNNEIISHEIVKEVEAIRVEASHEMAARSLRAGYAHHRVSQDTIGIVRFNCRRGKLH